MEAAGLCHQNLGEALENPRIAGFIGICEGGSSDVAADAQLIEMGRLCGEAGLDITEAFTVGQLRENQSEQLIVARESSVLIIPEKVRDERMKTLPW